MKDLYRRIVQIMRNRETRRFFRRSVSLTAAVIVFVTTYALVLPAITMERAAECGIEAHQHEESCYEELLVCGQEESDGHHHGDACYAVTEKLACESEEHQHTAENGCYDERGNLICRLSEHVHDDSCYKEIRTLTCGLEESDGHHHSDECWKNVLVCEKEEHTHSAACYRDKNDGDQGLEVASGNTEEAAAEDGGSNPGEASGQISSGEAAEDKGSFAEEDSTGETFADKGSAADPSTASPSGEASMAGASSENGASAQAPAEETDGAGGETGETEFKAGTLRAEGDGYRITLDYPAQAQIPESAGLSVREITEETDKEAYEACLEQANQHVTQTEEGQTSVDANATRFFDIEILVDGTYKIEPAAPVEVSIQLSDLSSAAAENAQAVEAQEISNTTPQSDPTILHFAEEGVEQIDSTTIDAAPEDESAASGEENRGKTDTDFGSSDAAEASGGGLQDSGPDNTQTKEVRFEAESFSVYGVIYTVDFHYEINGKIYDFSIPGGSFIELKDILKALNIVVDAGVEDEPAVDADTEPGVPVENKDEAGLAEGSDGTAPQTNLTADEFIAQIESVAFSNPELVSVSKVEENTTVGAIKDGLGLECEYSSELTEKQIRKINAAEVTAPDWALISLKPFETEESLTITMKNGDVFTIQVTDKQLRTYVLSNDGQICQVIVTYDETAGIPEDARLEVNRITEEDEAYHKLQNKLMETEQADLNSIPSDPLLLDISIWSGDEKIEPAEGSSVKVEIKLQEDDVKGIYSEENATLLINDKPLAQDDHQRVSQELKVIHDSGPDTVELMAVNEKREDNRIVGEFSTDSFSNWLLYLDEDLDVINVHVGDTITLRPYEEWYWKLDDEPQSEQALVWKFPRPTYYDIREGWQTVTTDYSGSTHQVYGVTQAKVGTTGGGEITINGYARYDRELKEEYWIYDAAMTATGDFNLYVGTGDKTSGQGISKTIPVHVEEGQSPQLPPTVDGLSNIKVNLFDYDRYGVLDDKDDRNLANNPFSNTINNGHSLKFLSSGSGNTNNGAGLNDYTKAVGHKGLVNPNMKDSRGNNQSSISDGGYPKLSDGFGGDSLAYLFDTSKTTWSNNGSIIAYPDVEGLFRQDGKGYYFYNSNINYAYYNPANNNKTITLYDHTYTQNTANSGVNSKPIGFFPFHQYNSTEDLSVNQNSNLNHHFGMSMEVEYMLPDARTVNGEHIIFEFTGDDDVWVYVDGQLALDIGGVHQPVRGYIDFTEGTVHVYGENNNQPYEVSFLKNLTTDEKHTLSMFYLERGGCDSNLSVRFNLPLVVGTVDFIKQDSANHVLPGAEFSLFETQDCTGTASYTAISQANGEVKFENVVVGTYYMKETRYPDGYAAKGNPKVYRVEVREEGHDGGTKIFDDSGSTPQDVTAIANTPIIKRLSVEKAWTGEAPANSSAAVDLCYAKRMVKNADGNEIANLSPWPDKNAYIDAVTATEPLFETFTFERQITLSAGNSWRGTFEGMPYKVTDASGAVWEFDYYAKETKVLVNGIDVTEKYGAAIVVTPAESSEPDSNLVVDNGSIAITNTLVQANLNIVKQDSKNSDIKLGGAEFTIREIDGTKAAITQIPAAQGGHTETVTSAESTGTAVFSNLTVGYYEIEETKSPAGYIISGSNKIYLYVGRNGTDGVIRYLKYQEGTAPNQWTDGSAEGIVAGYDPVNYQLSIQNEPGAELPASGGSGTHLFMLLGMLLTLGAGGILMMRRISRAQG